VYYMCLPARPAPRLSGYVLTLDIASLLAFQLFLS
jgi:hypothetical protein